MEYNKLIFVAQTGTCREAMAAGIMGDFTLRHPLEILSRGLVVQFQEPMNQKAEACLLYTSFPIAPLFSMFLLLYYVTLSHLLPQ